MRARYHAARMCIKCGLAVDGARGEFDGSRVASDDLLSVPSRDVFSVDGAVAERLKAPAYEAGSPQGFVGSNPTG